MRTPSYSRSQPLRGLWIVIGPAVALGGASAVATAPPEQAPWLAAVFAIVPVLVILFLGRLRIELDDTRLEWQFGYVGVPRWGLALADIASVETIRTRWIDGWGIHRGREGWIYNAEGFGAVRIRTVDGRSIRLGTDEPERLASFIAGRLVRRP